MAQNKSKKKLKECEDCKKEPNNFVQNCTSSLPSCYKSFQFVLFVAVTPILMSLIAATLQIIFFQYTHHVEPIFLAVVFFLIFLFTKREPLKMIAYIYFILILSYQVYNLLDFLYSFFTGSFQPCPLDSCSLD